MKIYTKTGDAGETGLFDGTRVPKSDPRVDAYGEVDELNACLGVVLSADVDEQVGTMIEHVQRDLFALGAMLADPQHRIAPRVTKATLVDTDIRRLERWIDEMEQELPPLRRFILAGGTKAGALLHLARAVCRRAERHIVALSGGGVAPDALAYINRLSDLLFVLARVVNHRSGVSETEW
jgi:cob(I)alamin adenosyltransferase